MSKDDNPARDFGAEFDSRLAIFEALLGEVEFILNDAVSNSSVKIHSLVGRVKNRTSFLEKITRKEYIDPFDEMPDIVGSRVVCLFRDDIPSLCEIVRSQFEVISEEDKIQDAPDDTFGYMSVHFVCKLRNNYTGPRYDQLKGVEFEVQVRTILMDAWANVSHHLAYKGEASIPAELRRDFNALSGLFYVADLQFQNFYNGVLASEKQSEEAVEKQAIEPAPLNRSTTTALLRELYPDRRRGSAAAISEFVEEAAKAGYTDLGHLRESLVKGHQGATRYEADKRRNKSGFLDVGIARIALAIADPDYAEVKYNGSPQFKKYRD